MKNTLADLNNHLFEQMERLNDESIVGGNLKEEIDRANAMAKVASQIINNGNLVLKIKVMQDERAIEEEEIPPMLGSSKESPKRK
ncbi:hypothetical protein [Terrisporobacter hibernicus]|uniref:Phage protein n=1 Tax=Terrisporobacter hibernicus TaxID=2813371 RepID=A0AAX2ZHK1_9FIRM|nr:hypothetical protein [Terrisporobacter hibernicus]UEL47554.1 hypothetical protein JW646_18335 [Terrisporobacter hibernicus]